MSPTAVLDQARQEGIELSATAEGKLRWRAPGALPDELREQLVQNKSALVLLLSGYTPEEVERFEERAAIAEHEGRQSQHDAERLAWEELQAARARQTAAT